MPDYNEQPVGQSDDISLRDMTLRDYFAAAYLKGRAARADGIDSFSEVAGLAYTVADAMLAARKT